MFIYLIIIFLIYLFILKFSSLNNFSEFRLPNLIFNFKNSTIHVHSFKYYFRYYYYYLIYLFILKIPSLNNFSKFRLPNLIFDFKNFTIHVHSFKYHFRYYYYYSIYLFKNSIFKQFFKIPASKFNFQSQKFHYSCSFV